MKRDLFGGGESRFVLSRALRFFMLHTVATVVLFLALVWLLLALLLYYSKQ